MYRYDAIDQEMLTDRAAGPTVHPHTGKQAGQYNA